MVTKSRNCSLQKKIIRIKSQNIIILRKENFNIKSKKFNNSRYKNLVNNYIEDPYK